MRLSEVIGDAQHEQYPPGSYLHKRRYVDGQAKGTTEKDRHVLTNFLRTVGDIQVRNITQEHCDAYRAARRQATKANGEPLGVSALNFDGQVLRAFFTWLTVKRLWRGVNPALTWSHETSFRKPFIFVPEDRFEEMLDLAKNPRDRARIAVGLFSFARDNEIVAATWREIVEIRPGQSTFLLNRKKTHSQTDLAVFEVFSDELRTWKTIYRNQLEARGIPWSDDLPLIPRLFGNRQPIRLQDGTIDTCPSINPTHIGRTEQMVSPILTLMGYETTDGEGTHTLRRSGGSAFFDFLRRNGEADPIEIIQWAFGHASRTTTELYLSKESQAERAREAIWSSRAFGRPGRQPARAEEVPVVARHLSVVRDVG